MFRSLFSERYSNKRNQFYQRYEEIRERFPDLPRYERPVEPSKVPKRGRKQPKLNTKNYDYDEWISGDFISIVVRRRLEEQMNTQLMARHTPNPLETFSHRTWPSDESQQLDMDVSEPRRSRRLIEKPRQKLAKIAEEAEEEVEEDEDMQKKHDIASDEFIEPPVKKPNLPFPCPINACPQAFIDDANLKAHQLATGHHQWQLQCKMCGKFFSCQLLQDGHTLDECRIYLLASLRS